MSIFQAYITDGKPARAVVICYCVNYSEKLIIAMMIGYRPITHQCQVSDNLAISPKMSYSIWHDDVQEITDKEKKIN